MKLDTRVRDVKAPRELRRYAEERVRAALSRVGGRVRRVLVQIRDENGPRGGVDMRCRLLATVQSGTHVIVEETRASAFAAVSGAADRLARIIRSSGRRRRARR